MRLLVLVTALAVGAPAGPAASAARPAARGASAATPAASAPRATPRKPNEAFDPALFKALEWRNIGPWRGGRAVAVTGVPGHPNLYYMGACGGGVWRTLDAGVNWESISDTTFGTGSVGAIAVAPSDPNVIYVGMGESPVRGNVSHGDGVYRSTDAGRSWRRVGLTDTRQIGRIRVHPNDPDLVYVAALGHLFGPNAERGVFRSRDGGATWQKILFVDDRTGAVDLCMDPTNPRILYAGFWQVSRSGWNLSSGGPGSGLWKSTDGGDSWTRLTGKDKDGKERDNGLPGGVLGKIEITISPARPERVWAMVEAATGGLFRSDDSGATWTRVSDDNDIRQRAWYFSEITADSQNPDLLWAPNVSLERSADGGRTFKPVRVPHGDVHAVWVDPDDGNRLIIGDDGGAQISHDGGRTWSSADNQPTAQFYHVITDNAFPYRVYGSQQDNSTVCIPSRTTGYGIERTDWYDVGGGESGYIAPSPVDNNIVYAGSYDGYLTRYDRRVDQGRDINVYPDNPMGDGAKAMKYRFQWTFPIVISPHDPNRLYAAANVLFKTTNEGQSWTAMSGDLTRADTTKMVSSGGPITKDNTSVEYYGTIFALAESPRQKGVIWTGSDDGLIYITRDDGAHWTNVTPKGLPEAQVNLIEAGPHDPATAYAAVVRYKFDDFAPYIYRTHDYGQSWQKIVNGIPPHTFVRAVREDPVRRGLLYAGTEEGIYVSFDDGARWQSLRQNLPVVPVTDIAVKGDDVVISTQGRAFWIMDDVTPLRQLDDAVAQADRHLFTPAPAIRMGGASFPRSNAGRNPANGAVVRYALAEALPDSVPLTLEFLGVDGRVLRKFSRKGEVLSDTLDALGDPVKPGVGRKLEAKAGLNSFTWDLRQPDATSFSGIVLWGGGLEGPVVTPGDYQARLTVGKRPPETVPLVVRKDPRLSTTDDDFARQQALLLKIRDKLTETHDATSRIRDVREQLDAVVARAKRIGKGKVLADSAQALSKRLTAVEEALYQTKSKAEEDPLNFPIRLNNKLSLLGETVASADARPTDQSYVVYDDLVAKIDAQLLKLRGLLGEGVAAFNRLVAEQGVPAVVTRGTGGQ